MNHSRIIEKLTEIGFAEYQPHDGEYSQNQPRQMFIANGDAKVVVSILGENKVDFCYSIDTIECKSNVTLTLTEDELLKRVSLFKWGPDHDINTRRDPELPSLRQVLIFLLKLLAIFMALRYINMIV